MPFFGMVEVASFILEFIEKYHSLVSDNYGLRIATFIAILVLICLFILEFYKSISKRNLISLNLRKYNTSVHPILSKVFALSLYLLEYIIIMPVLILLWFVAMAFVLLLVSSERATADVLFIAVAFIGAIRVLAYYKTEIAREVAKLFPLTVLSLYILTPNSANLINLFSNIQFLPAYLDAILSYMFVVFFIEIILRIIYELYDFWLSEEEAEAVEEK